MTNLPAPIVPSPQAEPAAQKRPGLFGRIAGIIGIVLGFVMLIVPGFFALRSYRRWERGETPRATFAWISAGVGILFVFSVLGDFLGEGLEGVVYGPVLSEDFSEPSEEWPSRTESTGSVGYVDAEYAIALAKPGAQRAASVWSEGFLPNVSVEAEARFVEGSGAESSVGVGCWDHEADVGYLFTASEVGYAILWFGPEDVEELASGPLDWDPASMHRIGGICRAGSGQSTLSLEFDGRQVAEVSRPEGVGASRFSAVMLIVGTQGKESIEVRFDDVLAEAVAPSAN